MIANLRVLNFIKAFSDSFGLYPNIRKCELLPVLPQTKTFIKENNFITNVL